MQTALDIYWERLAALDNNDVALRSGAKSVEPGIYEIRVLNALLRVDTVRHTIAPCNSTAFVLDEINLGIAVLRYLIECKAIDPVGEWVSPHQMKSGNFFQGHHAAPVMPIARRFGEDRASFDNACNTLGGKHEMFADSSYSFAFLPRIPVGVLLWLKDDEFEARAGMLFDRNAELHLPADALLAILVVMKNQLLGAAK